MEADPPSDAAALRARVLTSTPSDVESIKAKEEAIVQLCDAYVKAQDAAALTSLLADLRPFFSAIPKAKTAKIVRSIIDQIAKIPNSTEIQVWSERHSPTQHMQ
jgi:26S proteasome regulatory subunit N6